MSWIKQNLAVILVGVVSGTLCGFLGMSMTLWWKLPEHTLDLLAFTENAFGISITVLALIVALNLLHIPQKFDEATRNFQKKVKRFDEHAERLKGQLDTLEEQVAAAQSHLERLNGSVNMLVNERLQKPY